MVSDDQHDPETLEIHSARLQCSRSSASPGSALGYLGKGRIQPGMSVYGSGASGRACPIAPLHLRDRPSDQLL